jgi:hypothetical protein
VIRTFFVSHADATELATLLIGMVRVAGMAIQPQIQPNKTANTITVVPPPRSSKSSSASLMRTTSRAPR